MALGKPISPWHALSRTSSPPTPLASSQTFNINGLLTLLAVIICMVRYVSVPCWNWVKSNEMNRFNGMGNDAWGRKPPVPAGYSAWTFVWKWDWVKEMMDCP